MDLEIFAPIFWVVFLFFEAQKFLIFMKSISSSFSLVACILGIISKKLLPEKPL